MFGALPESHHSSSLDLARRQAQTISIPVEQNFLLLTLGTLERLNPLAGAEAGPHALEETQATILGIAAIMLAHNWLDGLGGLISMVKWDSADIVMQNVGLDDAVEELAADEAEFAVDGCCSATSVCPSRGSVVRERRVCVLKEGDHD
jgi:hypothetical protein